MNIEHWKKTRDRIADEDNPTGFDMGGWLARESGSLALPQDCYGTCGTTACIAGHAVNGEELLPEERTGFNYPDYHRAAARLLGITDREAYRVFYGGWVYYFPSDITRQDAIDYLDRCIEAGRVL